MALGERSPRAIVFWACRHEGVGVRGFRGFVQGPVVCLLDRMIGSQQYGCNVKSVGFWALFAGQCMFQP
jgi:hypothetical protein